MPERAPTDVIAAAKELGRYTGDVLHRQLGLARLVWIALFTTALGGLLFADLAVGPALMGAALALWFWANWNTARALIYLRQSAGMLHAEDPAALGAVLRSLRTFTLNRKNRVVAYVHLAMIRCRHGQFASASELCWALLSHVGSRDEMRARVWLIEAECRLRLGDQAGAYEALRAIHQQRLRLAEQLRLLALQTLYEYRDGQYERMLDNLTAKVRLIRMMPPRDGAATLAQLATAARSLGHDALAADLDRHSRLLTYEPEPAATEV
jgi:hypothetical protein